MTPGKAPGGHRRWLVERDEVAVEKRGVGGLVDEFVGDAERDGRVLVEKLLAADFM